MNITRIRRLAAAVTLAAALAAPAAAHADTRNIGFATGVTGFAGVLDVAGGSTASGAKVIQWPVNGGANQRWDIIGTHIINTKSQLCLTTSGVAGAQLYVTYCNAANRLQDWNVNAPQFQGYAQGSISNTATGLYIDVQGGSGLAGTPVIGWWSNDGNNQRFAYWYWN